MKAIAPEIDFKWGCIWGGIGFYTYQLALGITVRYWPCLKMPTLRLHLGPFKFWIGLCFGKREDGDD